MENQETWKNYELINFPLGKDLVITNEILFLPKKIIFKSYADMQASSCTDLVNVIKLLNSPSHS